MPGPYPWGAGPQPKPKGLAARIVDKIVAMGTTEAANKSARKAKRRKTK